MRDRLAPVIFFGFFFLILELYTYSGLKTIFENYKHWKLIKGLILLQALLVIYAFIQLMIAFGNGPSVRNPYINLWMGIILISFVTKFVFCSGLILQDLVRLFQSIYNLITYKFFDNTNEKFIPGRRVFITKTSLFLASIPFGAMAYGMAVGKYKYTLKNIKLAFSDLPLSFNGLKIVQISDIHSGSFDSKEKVKKGIDLINEQKPDLILFTGDLVNSLKDEINPYIELFKELKASMGKFAVLGNHDYYGLYGIPENEKEVYWADFMSKYQEMGFKLLNNENLNLNIGGDKIKLVGVENWGAGRYFPKEGDLDKALAGVEDTDFTILMSHDPTHWDHKVLPNKKNIHLTLSGHTHGMQFGIDIPGFKWSPVKYRYPRWSGLYEEQGQYLYVNRGFGFLGFPGRVGMWPEITVIELQNV